MYPIMNLPYALRYLYFYILFLYVKFMILFKQSPPHALIKPKSEIEKYESSYLTKFMKTFDQSTDQSTDQSKYNSNIDAILYNRKELLEQLKDPNNEYEQKWRKNILYETTPRGNIVMHYDIFKQGFAYYSDQTTTYNLLNVAAMKYCIYFSCRDFFTDEHILTKSSPFTKILIDEEKAESDKKKESVKQMIPNMANARLVKFKNYSTVDDKTKVVNSNKTDEIKIESLCTMNKFINLGKIVNFSFTQKIPINKYRVAVSESTVNQSIEFDAMFTDIKIDKGKLNYKDFKAAHAQAT